MRRLYIYFLLLTAFGFQLAANAQTPSPYQVKAAFIYNFLKFVEWPSQSFTNGQSPYVIGVLGRDPFGAALNDTMRGKQVNGRRISVVPVTEATMAQCHVLFVSSSERRRYEQVVQKLGSAPVLTIGDDGDFTKAGGMIGFVIENNKVRFQIRPSSAQRAGLKIHSTLLSLAKLVP